MTPKFDPTVNLGHVITVVTFIAGAASVFAATQYNIQRIDERTSNFAQIEDLAKKNDNRLSSVESLMASAAVDRRTLISTLDALGDELAEVNAQIGITNTKLEERLPRDPSSRWTSPR